MKRVSILLAVYNGGPFIEKAINSIINQTYNNWELLIVNNGSTDDTQDIISQFTVRDPRIRSFDIGVKGKNQAYNYAFLHSTGEYICFFAADDILPANSLERRLAGAIDDKMGFSTCLLKTFSDNPLHNGVVFPKNTGMPNFSGGSIMFSRALALLSFPIPTVLPNEDTWTSLHLRAFGSNTHLPEVLYRYRIHEHNSYGYGLDFEQKRSNFLERMYGYELFYLKYRGSSNSFVDTYVKNFVDGVALTRRKNIYALLLQPGLSLRDKAIFIFYSSALLYRVRHRYFKFFSGLFN